MKGALVFIADLFRLSLSSIYEKISIGNWGTCCSCFL